MPGRLVLLVVTLCATPAFAAKPPKVTEAMEAYRAGRFPKAIELFSAALKKLSPKDQGGALERDMRSKLVLSLYASKREDTAKKEYAELKARFFDFTFDPDRVSPDTIAFFEPKVAPPPEPAAPPAVASAPVEIVAAPSSTEAPREVTMVTEVPAAKKPWRWYYLAPLGIGQFLAGSPVRGVIFAVVEAGLITLNAVAFALLMRELRPDGTVPSLQRAQPLQIMANVGFFGWIGALGLGVLDGALLEP